MASKSENKKLIMDIINSLYDLDDIITLKRTTGYCTIETEKYLLDIQNMTRKVKEFYI